MGGDSPGSDGGAQVGGNVQVSGPSHMCALGVPLTDGVCLDPAPFLTSFPVLSFGSKPMKTRPAAQTPAAVCSPAMLCSPAMPCRSASKIESERVCEDSASASMQAAATPVVDVGPASPALSLGSQPLGHDLDAYVPAAEASPRPSEELPECCHTVSIHHGGRAALLWRARFWLSCVACAGVRILSFVLQAVHVHRTVAAWRVAAWRCRRAPTTEHTLSIQWLTQGCTTFCKGCRA